MKSACPKLDNVLWSFGFCGKRTQIGCLIACPHLLSLVWATNEWLLLARATFGSNLASKSHQMQLVLENMFTGCPHQQVWMGYQQNLKMTMSMSIMFLLYLCQKPFLFQIFFHEKHYVPVQVHFTLCTMTIFFLNDVSFSRS